MAGHWEPWCAWKGKLVVGIHSIGEATITSHGLQYIPPIGQELVLESTGPATEVLPLILGGSISCATIPQPLSLLHPTTLIHSTVTVTTITASTSHFATLITELNGTGTARAVCGRLRSLGGVLTEVLLLPQCSASETWGLFLPPRGPSPPSLQEQRISGSHHSGGASLFVIFVSSASSKQMLKNFALLAHQHAQLPVERPTQQSASVQCNQGVVPAADKRPLVDKASAAVEKRVVPDRGEVSSKSSSHREDEQDSKPAPSRSRSGSESSGSQTIGHSNKCRHDLNKLQPRRTCSKCHGYKVKVSTASDSPQPSGKGGKERRPTNEPAREGISRESVSHSKTDCPERSSKDRLSPKHETETAQSGKHSSDKNAKKTMQSMDVVHGNKSKHEKRLPSILPSSPIDKIDTAHEKMKNADKERRLKTAKMENQSIEPTKKIEPVPDSDVPILNDSHLHVETDKSVKLIRVKATANLHDEEHKKHRHRSSETKVTKSLHIHNKIREEKNNSEKSRENVHDSKEPVMMTQGKEPVMMTQGKEPVMMTQGKEPVMMTQGKEPVMMTQGKEPVMMTQGKEPVMMTQGKEPVMMTQGKEPVMMTQGKEPVMMTQGKEPVMMTQGKEPVMMTQGKEPVMMTQGKEPVMMTQGKEPVMMTQGKEPVMMGHQLTTATDDAGNGASENMDDELSEIKRHMEKLKKDLMELNVPIKTQPEFEKRLCSKEKPSSENKSSRTNESKCLDDKKIEDVIQPSATVTANPTRSAVSCKDRVECKNLKPEIKSSKTADHREKSGSQDDKGAGKPSSCGGSRDRPRSSESSKGALKHKQSSSLHANDGGDGISPSSGGRNGQSKDAAKDDAVDKDIAEDSRLDFLPNIEFDEVEDVCGVRESISEAPTERVPGGDVRKMDNENKIKECSPASETKGLSNADSCHKHDIASFSKKTDKSHCHKKTTKDSVGKGVVDGKEKKSMKSRHSKKLSEKGISSHSCQTVDPAGSSRPFHHKSKRHSSTKSKSLHSSQHPGEKQEKLRDDLTRERQKSSLDSPDVREKHHCRKQISNLPVRNHSPLEGREPRKEADASRYVTEKATQVPAKAVDKADTVSVVLSKSVEKNTDVGEKQNRSEAVKSTDMEHSTLGTTSKEMASKTVRQNKEPGKEKMVRFKNKPSWSIGRKRKAQNLTSAKPQMKTDVVPDKAGEFSGRESTGLLSSMRMGKVFKVRKDPKISSIKPSIICNEDLEIDTNELIGDLETNCELRAILASFDSRLDFKTEKSLVEALRQMNVPDDKVEKVKEKIMRLICILSPELELKRVEGKVTSDNDQHIGKDKMNVRNNTTKDDTICTNQPLQIEDVDLQKSDKVKGWKRGVNKIRGFVEKFTSKRKDEIDLSTTAETSPSKRAKLDRKSSITIGSKIVGDAFEQTSSSVFGFTGGQETTDTARFGDVDSPVRPRHAGKKRALSYDNDEAGHLIPRTLSFQSTGNDADNYSQTHAETLSIRNVNRKPVREPLLHMAQMEPLDLSVKGDGDDGSRRSSLLRSSDNTSRSRDHWEDPNVVECNLPSSHVEKHYLLDKFLEAMKDEVSVDLNNTDGVSDAGSVSLLRKVSSRSNIEQPNVSALSKSSPSHTVDADGTNRLLSLTDLDQSGLETPDGLLVLRTTELPRVREPRLVACNLGGRQMPNESSSFHKPCTGSFPTSVVSDKIDRFIFPQPIGSSPVRQPLTDRSPEYLRRASMNMGCGALSGDNVASSASNVSRDTLEKERRSVSAVLEYMKEMDRNIMAQHLALQRKDESIQRGINYLSSLMKKQEVDLEDVNPKTSWIDSYILRQLQKLHGIEIPPTLPLFDNGGQSNACNPMSGSYPTAGQYSQMNPFVGVNSFNHVSAIDNATNFSLPTSLARSVVTLCPRPFNEPGTAAVASTPPFQFASSSSNNLPVLSGKPPIHPNSSLLQKELLQSMSEEMGQWQWQSLDSLCHLVHSLDSPVDLEHFKSSKYASIYMPTADERAHFKRLLVSQRLFYAPLLSLREGGGHLLVRSSALPGLVATDATLSSLLAREDVSVCTFGSVPELAEGRVTARLRLGALLLLDHSALLDPQLGVLLHNLALENDRLMTAFNVVIVTKSTLRKCYILSLKRRPSGALETKMVAVLRANLDLLLSLSRRGLVHAVTGITDSPAALPALHRALRFMHRAALLLTGARVPGGDQLSGEDTAPSPPSFYRTLPLASLFPTPPLPATPLPAWLEARGVAPGQQVDQAGRSYEDLTGARLEGQLLQVQQHEEEMARIPTIVITSPTKREPLDRNAVQSPSITSCREQSSQEPLSSFQSAKRKACDSPYQVTSLGFPSSGTSLADGAAVAPSSSWVPAPETMFDDLAALHSDVTVKTEPQTKKFKLECPEPSGPVNIFDETVLFDMEDLGSSHVLKDAPSRPWLSSTERTVFPVAGKDSAPPSTGCRSATTQDDVGERERNVIDQHRKTASPHALARASVPTKPVRRTVMSSDASSPDRDAAGGSLLVG